MAKCILLSPLCEHQIQGKISLELVDFQLSALPLVDKEFLKNLARSLGLTTLANLRVCSSQLNGAAFHKKYYLRDEYCVYLCIHTKCMIQNLCPHIVNRISAVDMSCGLDPRTSWLSDHCLGTIYDRPSRFRCAETLD